jgi:transcriptional regulator with XRE-family HTH domain
MNITGLMTEIELTQEQLAKKSHIPLSKIEALCLGKAKIENCSGRTLYRLAKALDVRIETLLVDAMENRTTFENFKSNVCHRVRFLGDIGFLEYIAKTDKILDYLEKRWYREALYMLGMIDYLCRENELPLNARYEELRKAKLNNIIYPAGVLILCAATNSEEPKEQSLREAIPEFLRHNIVEAEVRNVV